MKKIIAVLLLITLVLSLAGCKEKASGGEGYIGDKNSPFDENASENATINNSVGTFTMDESTVKQLLSAYPAEAVGLKKSIYDYAFGIEQVVFNGKTCFKATANDMENQSVEGIFYILGTECYKYDSAQDKYYLLTLSGTEKVDVTVEETKSNVEETQEVSFHQKTEDEINDENTQVLRARYKNYDLSVVGITKPIDNYTFLATGNTAQAADGAKVFVIYLLENGQRTEYKFAIGTNGKDYYYDSAADEYKVLS